MERLRPAVVGSFLLALGAACTPAAPPSPTVAPAQQPATVAPAVQPTAAPGKPAADKPPATVAAEAKPAAMKVPKPGGNLAIKIGETAGLSFSRLPARITQDRLNAEGWKIEPVEFRGTDLIAEAVSSGEVQLARFQFLDAIRTVQAGGKLKLLVEDRPEEFVIIAKKEIARCDDLNGKRYAVHSEGSPYTVMSAKWMADTCGARPNRLVISGGENRIVALMNNQIDATFVQLSDWVNIDSQRPGEFPILMKFSESLPGLMGGVIVANTGWLEQNREVATAYVAEGLLDNRRTASDPKLLEDAVKKYQAEAELKAFPKTYESYHRDLGGFPQNGGSTPERVRTAIALFTELDLVKPGLTVDQVADTSVLESALRLIGPVQGKL